MNQFQDWYREFLHKRGLERPDGHMLFRYRVTQDEYISLRSLFSAQLAVLNGSPWKFGSTAECALFVLYASEWWRREYAGGPWRWTQIFESLTTGPYDIDIFERTDAVERGLRAWGHRPSEEGRRYLGAIVAHGGLPLQMVAQGDGAITRLLHRGLHQAQLLGWSEMRLEEFFEAHALELVQHLRASEIYKLLASVILTVLELRKEFQLAGVSNPVAFLDNALPTWRERFPIAVDAKAAEPLLVGLVKEAAREVKPVTSYPLAITRSLVKLADGESYGLSMSIQLASSITLSALAAAMGVTESAVPQAFTLELTGAERIPLGQGRQLLGGQESMVMLSGKPRRFTGDAARRETLVVLRGLGADIHAPSSVPGGEGLEDSQPWVFADRDGALLLLGLGSCKIREDSGFVAVAGNCELTPSEGSKAELIGLVEGISEARLLYEVQGSVTVTGLDEVYQIKTAQANGEGDQLIWKGVRLGFRTSPFPVYLGVPSLYRMDFDGLMQPVSARDIDWVLPGQGGALVQHVKHHRGPIDAWIKVSGVRQRRFRMVLVSSDAGMQFTSGATEREGEIDFRNWGITELKADPALVTDTVVASDSAKLALKAKSKPPSSLLISMGWPRSSHALQVELPFPSTGGRFCLPDGEILADGICLPLRKSDFVRLQVFDRNPNAPKRYSLAIELQGTAVAVGRSSLRAEINIPLDNGFGELRFFEIATILYGLMCQSDSLDAKLVLSLCVAQVPIRQLYLTRYDAPLERDLESLAVSANTLEQTSPEVLMGVKLRALPLLELQGEDIALDQMVSNGVPVGRWNLRSLTEKHSPWLIYPAVDSSLQLRPTLYELAALDRLAINTGNPCPLAIAMNATTQRDRERQIRDVVADMAQNFEHRSWALVARQHSLLRHLPLSTLDYWRVFARSHEASVAVVLKLGDDIPGLMLRMRQELGVVWELIPNKVLQDALKMVSDSMASLLKIKPGDSLHTSIVFDLFRKMGLASRVLAEQIDYVLFRGGFGMGEHFQGLVEASRRHPKAILQALWSGEDSMLQRILLRAHAEDRIWPHFNLMKTVVEALEQQCDKCARDFLWGQLGKELLWIPPVVHTGPYNKNVKEDVANVPMLAALMSQLTGSTEWWQVNGRMGQLRQIREFDPVWFEESVRIANLLALKSTK